MRAFDGEVAIAVAQLYLCPHVAAYLAGRVHRAVPPDHAIADHGGLWLHEIKHDGFRIIARKDGERVRHSRPGY
jgi:ATP-dependent DNA ligase